MINSTKGGDITHDFPFGKRTMVLAVYILKTQCNCAFIHNHHFVISTCKGKDTE